MKPQLTLKHLAPYLPYGLKCKWNQSNPFILVGLQKGNESVNNDLWTWKDGSRYLTGYLYECKPILRPLSDLTNEIEHNGEKFIPMEYIMSMNSKSFKESLIKDRLTEALINDLKHNRLQYKYCEKLFEWHFDVFGLIPEGLAIDINTL